MFDIHDLRERRHQVDGVAERIWTAFWRHKGTPLEQLRRGVEANLHAGNGVPFCLVAEIEGKLCGTASIIENDEEARPELTPWLAALWVDEAARGQGIAAALLNDAARRCAVLGIERLYLVSRPALRDFYTSRGWREVEQGVGAHALTLYVRELGREPISGL
jgi:GNAT superfamily N-acetyltransferase